MRALACVALLVALGGAAEAAVSGRVYDSVSGRFVQDARVTLLDDATGQPLDAARLLPGQQGQLTPAEGFYRFDPPPGGTYRIAVEASGWSFPSQRVPPAPGLAPGGPAVPSATPAPGGPQTYYLRFAADVTNDHLPLDPLDARIVLEKHADRPRAAAGDVVRYTVVVVNRSTLDVTGARLRDTPARGLAVAGGRASAQVTRGGATLSSGTPFAASDGATRVWGPFDLPVGATLTLGYEVAIPGGLAPGDYDNRAVLVGADGAQLSGEGSARVRVGSDPFLDEGLLVGRVRCADGRGVFGARVYIDTGSYARTDSAGAWHLSRVPPGVHLVKLDDATLPPGATLEGEAGRVVDLTRGLALKLSWTARCPPLATVGPAEVEIAPGAAAARAPASVTVAGSLADMTAAVDGQALPLPQVVLALAPDRQLLPGASANLRPATVVPFAVSVHWPSGTPRAYRLTIVRSGRTQRVLRGDGPPPPTLVWDGRGADGRPAGDGLFEAQLRVSGDDVEAASSARLRFGVGYGLGPGKEDIRVLRGDFFAAGADGKPQATDALRRALAAVARDADGGIVFVEVHDDGTGDTLERLARTQKESEVARALLVGAGVAANRVQARGRGNLAVLDPAGSPEARRKNRRVVVKIALPGAGAGATVPPLPPGMASALVAGLPATVVHGGRFARNLARPADGQLLVDLLAADGRQAVVRAHLPAAASEVRPLPRLEPAPVAIAGDLAAGTLSAFGRPVDTSLLGVDLGVRMNGERIELAPVLPAELQIASWAVEVWTTDFEREPQKRLGGSGGPPAVIPWPGGRGAAGRTLFRLTVEDPLGGRGESPVHVLSGTGFGALALTGALFTPAGEPTPALRRGLAAFVATSRGRPPSERYLIEATLVIPKELNAAEAKLAVATRAGRVKELLGALRPRVDVALRPGTRPSERLDITAQMVAPAPAPRALVDGQPVELRGSQFNVALPIPPGRGVVVDVRTTTGHHAVFVVGERQPEGTIPKVRDLKPPEVAAAPPAFAAEPHEFGAAELEDALARPGAAAPRGRLARVPAAELEVRLPPRDAELRAPELWIAGRTAAGNRVAVNGRAIEVRADGSFDALAELPPGDSVLAVESTDADGNRARVKWPVRVAAAQHTLLVLAEAAFGNTRLDGMTGDSTATIGDDFFLHGRVAAYYTGRFRSDGFFKSYQLTAHLDTAKIADSQDFFQQVIDPVRGFGTFGDSADEVRDVNARGKLYLRLRADDSTAIVGDFAAGLGAAGSLLRYERTVYGAGVDFVRGPVEAKGFVAPDLTDRLARDVNVFRATGGSLYYLRHANLIPGGERVRVVVRDRDTNLVLSERTLARDADYRLDARGGRLQLTTPLASEADASWALTNLAGPTLAPGGGHPVFVEVCYEYEPDQATDTTVAGGYVRDRIGAVEVGAGAVGESRAGGGYSLFGAEATWRPAAATTLHVELARSEAADATTALSADGGLSFQDVGLSGSGGQLGWRAELASVASDFAPGEWAQRARLRIYAQELDDGFRSMGTILDQGHRKIGGLVSFDADPRSTLTLRADTDRAGDATAQLESVRWEHRGPLGWLVEAGHQEIADASRWGLAAAGSWKVARRLVLRAAQQVQLGKDDDPILHDRSAGVATSVGADVELAKGLVVSGTGALRWNGDTALTAGLKTPVDDHAAMYVAERLEGRSGRTVATSIVGGEEQLGAGARAYGEYQLENGASAERGRAVLGVGHRVAVAPGVHLDAGFEHQESLGGALPDGTPVGKQRRDLVRAGAELLGAAVKATAQVELRLEDGGDGPAVPLPATGSPLVLPPGARRQIVAGAAAEWKWTADQTFLLRFRLADTHDTTGDTQLARSVEATAGWALRPLALDWLDLIVHYSYLYDQRPDLPGVVERAHVLALAPLVDLPRGLQLSGKLVWKRDADADAVLGILRLGLRLRGRWDVAVEGRALHIERSDGDDTQTGALLELAYDLSRFARVGGGYNFSHFSDDELADLEHDGHGFFVRIVGRY